MNVRVLLGHCLAVVLTALALCGPAAAQENAAQTVLHMLDYVGVDYAGAVEGGKVKDEGEFKEMVEFTTEAVTLLGALPANPQRAALVAEARKLARMVENKAAPGEVAAAAGKLRWAVIAAYNVTVAPKAAPDLAAGAKLYQSQCAACHGAEGKGDGPAGAKLDPAPANFHDRERMAQRSVYGLYSTITLGVKGTSMAPFGQLGEQERWALAFHVAGMGAAPADRVRGEKLWREGQGRQAFPDLANLATLSHDEMQARYGEEAAAVWSYLVGQPDAVTRGKPGPIDLSLAKLEEALAAYRAGDRAAALQLAITAYLEGFELAEASLRNVDEPLMIETEREMIALRAMIADGKPLPEVEQRHAKVRSLLEQSRERLSGDSLSPGATFTSALIILLREGLEAILVLAAILAFLVKTSRRDALPYVHAGWIGALLLGALTWFAASYVIGVSGASREITEGVTALLSAAILVYVGLWLHGKAYAHRWREFIREQIDTALGKRTMWAMAAVSFLAVYREVFETVLFYEALWAQTGSAGQGALLGGIAVGTVLLVATAWAIFKYSVRLPIGPFFAVTSVLLAAMAVIFAGQGIAALQEAGQVPISSVDFVRVPALGIFPTVQSLGMQVAVLVLLGAGFLIAGRGGRDGQETKEA
jgi:high-affinity iron transporter